MSNLNEITSKNPLLLIGCGKMGAALLQGWLSAGLSPDAVRIVDPYAANIRDVFPLLNEDNFAVNISDLNADIKPSFIVMAVKPQMMDEAMTGLKSIDCDGAVFLSIAAGKTLDFFERHMGHDAAVVRAMPNTPAAIGRGITVACAGGNVSKNQKAICRALLQAAGAVEWVEDEALIDAVTAVSGSGPAYVFYMVEALADAGEKIGLPSDLAYKLAHHTICGAGALLEQSDLDASQLRVNVTSPKGTTEAALNILMGDKGLGKNMADAVYAAHQRSKELAD